MASKQLDEERVFHLARLLPSKESVAEYLDQICARDQALRERVEALLAVHDEEQSFLASVEPTVPPTVDLGKRLERPGITIGRYKLMEQIGEGGMGTVFVAQQERPKLASVSYTDCNWRRVQLREVGPTAISC